VTQFISIWIAIISGLLIILGYITTVVWKIAKLAGNVEALQENHKALIGRLIASEDKQEEDIRISNSNFSRIFDKIESIYQILINKFQAEK